LAFSGRGSLATVESRHIDVPVAMPGRSDWGGKHFRYFSMAHRQPITPAYLSLFAQNLPIKGVSLGPRM
jgi:hypothetical protein